MAYIRCSGNIGGSLKVRTASGNPCTFTTDLADALVSLTADIVAKQDLHGYDHPWPAGGGKNLFDKSTIIDGFWIRPNGTTDYAPNRMYSDLIRIKPNTQYYITNTIGGNDFFSTIHYDSNLNILGAKNVGGSGDVSGTITSYNDSVYMRINSFLADLDTLMVSEGNTATEYEPYSNICPIVGHSELNLTRCGVNLFDDTCLGYYTEEITLPAGTYYFKGFISTTGTDQQNTRFYWLDDTNTWQIITTSGSYDNGAITWTGSAFGWETGTFYATVTLTKPETFRMSCSNTTANTRRVGIFLTNVDTFTPYNGQTFTVAFGQTVYGGVYDKSGRLTITHGYKTYDGSNDEDWGFINAVNRAYISVSDIDISTPDTDIADVKANIYVSGAYSGNGNRITGKYNIAQINVFDSSVNNISEWRTLLSNTPLTVAYELATPIVIDVPSISVFAENGTNNIVSDCGGDVNVTYIKKV